MFSYVKCIVLDFIEGLGSVHLSGILLNIQSSYFCSFYTFNKHKLSLLFSLIDYFFCSLLNNQLLTCCQLTVVCAGQVEAYTVALPELFFALCAADENKTIG